jgi:hypothetical protein
MEGYKDVYWTGDRIVWRNLLRHYLLCLSCAVMPIGPGLSVSCVSDVSSAFAASCISATASALRSRARSIQTFATLSCLGTCRGQYRFFASASAFCNVASRSRSALACSGRPLRASSTARAKCGQPCGRRSCLKADPYRSRRL